MNYTALLAKANDLGLSDRAIRSIVFDDRATDDAVAGKLLADAREVTALFNTCHGLAAHGYDIEALRDDFIEQRISPREVAKSILQTMYENRGDDIDTSGSPLRTVALALAQQSKEAFEKRNQARQGSAR